MKSYHIVILALALLSLAACKKPYTEKANPDLSDKAAQAVRLETLKVSDTPFPIASSGMVASESEMSLSFKIGGIIQRVYVEEGQKVRKGQLLASLRTTEIDAQVMKARQAADKAKRDLDRIQKLYADSAATLEMVENLTTAHEVAQSDLQIAEFNQSYAKIVAPTNGRVLRRFAENNELIGPGNPVYRVASSNGGGFILKLGVSDKDVIRLKLNDKAKVKLDPYPNQEVAAYVSEIAEAADPRTGTFEVELSLKPKGLTLKNGFIGKASIFPSEDNPHFEIGMAALVEGAEDQVNIYVATEDETKAQKLSVRPQYIGDGYFTVSTDQLDQHVKVITEGAAYLKDGAAIRVVEAQQKSSLGLLDK
ncbi:MAG: efflux RND transporter periplasmic adaptor subunit [Bacteroidota bacterium]